MVRVYPLFLILFFLALSGSKIAVAIGGSPIAPAPLPTQTKPACDKCRDDAWKAYQACLAAKRPFADCSKEKDSQETSCLIRNQCVGSNEVI